MLASFATRCERVFATLKRPDPLLDIARKLEELALKDQYFIERNLYPNVDFYSGLLLRSMGIPTNMFTVIFSIGRLPGWIAHWKEQHDDPTSRILRPRQVYQGPNETDIQTAMADPSVLVRRRRLIGRTVTRLFTPGTIVGALRETTSGVVSVVVQTWRLAEA